MFKDKLKLVPHLPGSYQMKNESGQIIYVGKAKDLHRRLSSYFNRTNTGKTAKMVSEIADFTYIVATSEIEAFLIEFNLIKKYDPKYNIMLKDDKSYPYIEYIKKPYPRLKVSRYLSIRKKDNKTLFGPYPNAYAARRIVNLLNRLYPLKKCESMPKKVCLYYHIGECLGYCQGNIDPKEMEKMEHDILSFLRGNDNILKDKIKEKIATYSESLNYEMALELKKELDYINIVLDKQKVELHDLVNRDVIGYMFDKGYISIQIFFLRNGKLLGGHSGIFPVISEVLDDLEFYLAKFYLKHEHPKELFVPADLNNEVLKNVLDMPLITPQKGTKKKLLDMAFMNAEINLKNELASVMQDEAKTEAANEELKEVLHLPKLDRIDVFDNSNLFGSFAVSGMVVFKNGHPAKKEYRKYKISLEKNDDYNTMKEVIYRRYYRALIEKTELPDLIIVDGGLNQINACKEVIESLNLPIKICGLRKNDHHRTNDLLDGDTYEVVDIPKMSNVFHYLTRIQDEVHRYTITYHRNIRSKGSISSVLDRVEGIGPKRKKELIKAFGSISKIASAEIKELTNYLPLQVATNLKNFLMDYQTNLNEKEK